MVDIFSFSKERKMEIELLKSYENDLNFISNNFNRQNKKILIEIARLPTKVLGFGPVKIKSIEDHYLQKAILYTKLKEFNKIKLAAAE
jgi:indolepyruvate ferredoxin oxidoreductase